MPAKWWPIRADDPARWWAQTLLAGVIALWVILLALTAAFDRSPGPLGHALSIALGTVDPFEAEGADIPAVLLAILSWVLVPTIVGTVAALLVENQLKRARPVAAEERRERLEELRNEVLDGSE